MIYVMDGLPRITSEQLALGMALVPPYRREYAERYRFEADRIQSIFAFLLLQYALREEYAIREAPQLDYNGGKPVIANFPHVQCNLSHCKLAVACALSDRPVGVDVQDWSPRHLSIVTRVCTQQERAFLERSPNQEAEFAKLWTRKESYGKYTGKGILYSMNEQPLLTQAPDGTIMETVTFDGYALSYCAEEALKIQRVTLADLLQGRKER